MSRLWRLLARDRAALAASLQTVLAWPFERVLPGHGEIFAGPDADATIGQTRAALAWALRS